MQRDKGEKELHLLFFVILRFAFFHSSKWVSFKIIKVFKLCFLFYLMILKELQIKKQTDKLKRTQLLFSLTSLRKKTAH